MAGSIRVDTAQVVQIANTIDTLNKQLREQLETSKQTIVNLGNSWEGEASQATIESYNAFAGQYFESYEQILNQYVTFLKNNVALGYEETETANTNLADAFK
jgi:WXG100 family type VII secretion target